LSRDVEVRGEYAHDTERSVAETDCLPEYIRLLVKDALPQLITDKGNVIMASDTITGLQIATQNRLNAEYVQKIGTSDEDSRNTGVLVPDGESSGAVAQDSQLSEHGSALLPDLGVPRIGTGHRKSTAKEFHFFPENYQLTAVTVGERFQDHGVDEREDRRSDPDTQSKRENGEATKAR
jgi:hypothetical protein